jgi:hypothetical protein
MTIRNSEELTLNWTIDYDCHWLTVEPNSGSSTGEANEVVLSVDTNGLDPNNDYICELIVSDPNAENSPQTVEVKLNHRSCFPSGHPDYDEWVAVGSPSCWCYPRQCHGDADGIKHGGGKVPYHYVGMPDLDILADAWKVAEPKSGGPGLTGNQICADFDHTVHGGGKVDYHRVGTPDLDILATYWKVPEPESGGPGVNPNCLDVP